MHMQIDSEIIFTAKSTIHSINLNVLSHCSDNSNQQAPAVADVLPRWPRRAATLHQHQGLLDSEEDGNHQAPAVADILPRWSRRPAAGIKVSLTVKKTAFNKHMLYQLHY